MTTVSGTSNSSWALYAQLENQDAQSDDIAAEVSCQNTDNNQEASATGSDVQSNG